LPVPNKGVASVAADHSEKNKRVVSEVFDIIYGPGDSLHRIDDLIAEDYVQHNPLVPDGREGFRRFFEQAIPLHGREEPGEVHLIAEGDYVVRQELRENGMLLDVFRLIDGQLKEHWDAFRPSPDRWPWF
jgi:predicted SnoaL-like aldol condensation-catalyzing enzyme